MFLRYQAQTERHYRRAVEEFERLKRLRPELPNEPIFEDQPEENEPVSPSETNPSSPPDPDSAPAPAPPPELPPAPAVAEAGIHIPEKVGRGEGSAVQRDLALHHGKRTKRPTTAERPVPRR